MFGGSGRRKDDASSLSGVVGATTPENSPSRNNNSVTGFDPEGLERAAKAARDLDASRNAPAAIELIKSQEVTKQHELATKRAEYDAYTQQQRQVNLEAEANEARKTLDAQTQHEKHRMEYQDQLERKRQVDMLNAQKYMQEYVLLELVCTWSGYYFLDDSKYGSTLAALESGIGCLVFSEGLCHSIDYWNISHPFLSICALREQLKKQEEMVARQEEMRRKTAAYEAELRTKTEVAREKAKSEGRIAQERANHDLILSKVRLEAAERRDTVLQAIRDGGALLGQGISSYLNDTTQLRNTAITVTGVAVGIYAARTSIGIAGRVVEARLGKPSLIRETSRWSVGQWFRQPLATLQQRMATSASSTSPETSALRGMVFKPSLEEQLRKISVSTANTKKNRAPFRHLLLHGTFTPLFFSEASLNLSIIILKRNSYFSSNLTFARFDRSTWNRQDAFC